MQKMLFGLGLKHFTFSILRSLKLSFSATVFGTTYLCAIVFWVATATFAYSCHYARPIKVENLLSNALVTFNLENVNLLSNLNINPKNGLAYKKTCSEPQILEAIQNKIPRF